GVEKHRRRTGRDRFVTSLAVTGVGCSLRAKRTNLVADSGMRGPGSALGGTLMEIAKMQDLIVDDRARGIFRVNRRAFTDPEILEQERREVFDRSWLYAGHESEIANAGDFVTRKVGGRPIILV